MSSERRAGVRPRRRFYVGYRERVIKAMVRAALCAVVAFGVCSCQKAGESDAAAGMNGKQPPAPVRIGKVIRKSMPVQLTEIGNIEPYTTVSVKAQVSGEIKEVHFTEGDMVKEGQLLFTIDPRPFEVALRQAEANLARAKAQHGQAVAGRAKSQAEAENARVEFERNKPLLEQKMVSQEEYDQSRAAAEAAAAAVAADDASIQAAAEAIQSAQADIDEAKLQLDYCSIEAPVEGRTGSLLMHKGNLVRTNDTSPMVVINQVHPIYATFSLPEKHLAAVREAMSGGPLAVEASIPQQDGPPAQGTLTFIDNAVNEGTGMIRFKATFENTDDRLWPGQFVTVSVHIAVMEDAVVAPAAAVQMGQQGMYVYVVKEDMTVEVRPVVAGTTVENLTVIESGLTPDEAVVTDGLLRTAPGATVTIQPDESGAEGKR